ncbi:DUF3325 domain-containing protein [Siccirubricoccus phaeus]|uniref:DUF3325 domain-containing protein n=1 Tax=Siccirubricoccus phaeus TaxID=2595053 RepID=UPI0011F19E4F|nr:DUF3325 domain-containing protein [Siccirubricoccus phaeus]
MAVLALGLAYPGFLLLSLAMDRHHRELLGGAPPRPRRLALRLTGAALLGLSTLPCFALWGWSIGPVAWCGVLTVAALGLVALLAFAPRAAVLLAPLLPVLGLSAWIGLE